MTTERGFSACGDGYDYIELARKAGWSPVSCWGADGWDLGDWPYVVVLVGRKNGRAGVRTYCEGDLTTDWYDTADEADAAIDEIARYYWTNDPARYGLEGRDLSAPEFSGSWRQKVS